MEDVPGDGHGAHVEALGHHGGLPQQFQQVVEIGLGAAARGLIRQVEVCLQQVIRHVL
jgi:hypothetical protein